MYDDRSQAGAKSSFETYRSEGDLLVKQQEYQKALEAYNVALELCPDERNCLVARSRCHLELGETADALKDAEDSMKEDSAFFKGILCKADALYFQGDFEMSLVFYHRGNRLRPEQREFRLGIQKCQEAIVNSVGSPERVKLENKGDLSYFHKFLGDDDKKKKTNARFAATNLQKVDEKKARSRSSGKDKSVKHLLGQLYADRSFLEQLLKEEDERIALLDTCPRCGYRLSMCTCSTLVTRDYEAKNNAADKGSIPLFSNKYNQRRTGAVFEVKPKSKKDGPEDDSSKRNAAEDIKVAKTKTSEAIHRLLLGGLTYLDTRTDFWRQQKPMYARKRDREMQEAAIVKRKETDPTKFIMRSLAEIDEAQSQNKYEESLLQCKQVKRLMKSWTDSELPNKPEFLAHTYSYMGHAYLETGNPDKALQCHRADLQLSEKHQMEDSNSRAKDNIGRVYARTGKFQDAVNMWEAKMATTSSDLERAWLYHEIGRCYLELGEAERARRDGELSMKYAGRAEDGMWQLNASVLIAQAEVKMGDYLSATDSFERSMEMAKLQNDKTAQEAIVKALEEINDKIINSIRNDFDDKEAAVVDNGMNEEDDAEGDDKDFESADEDYEADADKGDDGQEEQQPEI